MVDDRILSQSVQFTDCGILGAGAPLSLAPPLLRAANAPFPAPSAALLLRRPQPTLPQVVPLPCLAPQSLPARVAATAFPFHPRRHINLSLRSSAPHPPPRLYPSVTHPATTVMSTNPLLTASPPQPRGMNHSAPHDEASTVELPRTQGVLGTRGTL